MCGFANTQGGVLEIGRNDQGNLVGVKGAARLMEEPPNKARDLLGIMVYVNLHTDGGKDYLQIGVEAYPNPISYRGEYYYRSGSTNQMLIFGGASAKIGYFESNVDLRYQDESRGACSSKSSEPSRCSKPSTCAHGSATRACNVSRPGDGASSESWEPTARPARPSPR